MGERNESRLDDNASYAPSSSGDICIAESPVACLEPTNGFMCSLPAGTVDEAVEVLESIGSGAELGSGLEMSRLGVSMPTIREEYEKLIQELIREVNIRKARGQPSRQIAEFAVKERRRIANAMRMKSGIGTRVLFEVRDWSEYGPGGRTLRNVESRYIKRGVVRGQNLNSRLITGATSPNTGISNTAIKGARYLKHGGKVVIVLSIATTAYTLLTTPEDQLEQVIYEETGGFLGGSVGTSVAVGACLVFGIATGGWGLLACGIVGGVVGGTVGTYAGNRIYNLANEDSDVAIRETGILDVNELLTDPPAPMCVAPVTR